MKLSVMMLTYNHERFIAQALASILSQRVNFDYEIVVGEDCSNDGTRAVLMDFYRRYPDRIVPLLQNRNIGMMRNLQATISACRGQYLAWLEGDDYWTNKDKLQKQVDFLDAHPDYSLCCYRAEIVDEMGTGQTGIFPHIAAGTYAITDLLNDNFVMTCTAMYRWGSIGPLPGWFRRMKLGDWPLHALVASQGQIELLDEVSAVYRVHSGGAWSVRSEGSRVREIDRMLTALDKHLRFQYRSTIRRTLARQYFELASRARQNGNRKETGMHLARCLRTGGWWQLPVNRPLMTAFAAYALLGSWRKIFKGWIRATRNDNESGRDLR
jgi:glycosyltransferase involved in cell wall biosynthesis